MEGADQCVKPGLRDEEVRLDIGRLDVPDNEIDYLGDDYWSDDFVMASVHGGFVF